MNKVMEKGKAQTGTMDVIPRDLHLDNGIGRSILIIVTVLKLEYAGEIWEGSAKLAKQLETVQMTAPEEILELSKRRVL